MKDLVFSSFSPDVISYLFEEAEISYMQGNEVTLVVCNDSICQCPGNLSKNKTASERVLLLLWQERKESNLHTEIQRLMCYHYTTLQCKCYYKTRIVKKQTLFLD